MNKSVLIFFISCFWLIGRSQEKKAFLAEANYYYGSLLKHNKDVAHLVREHPEGVLFSWSKKTTGRKYWEQEYGLPDWGISLGYQDFNYDVLGKTISAYGHFNFYFFNRKLQLKLAQGIGLATNPHNLDTNFKNIAHGSKILAATFLALQYQQHNLYKGFGLQAGLLFSHHSNGSFQSPNSGSNIVGISLGAHYEFGSEQLADVPSFEKKNYLLPPKLHVFLRGGLNSSDYIGLGQQPFVILGALINKRISYKSSFQLGTELFISEFLDKEIEYRRISFGDEALEGVDYKRIGVFAGYELRISRFAIPMQLGYYVYWPYRYESRVYTRIGGAYYFSETLYGLATVKTHGANAEAIEFGIGIQL